MNILIVYDEKLLRDVVKEYCLKENYKVFEAENGLDALEIVENNSIDLIVLDIMMPKMDGYTFFKELKNKENIPTIILSARNDEYDKLLGFDLGIDDYLTKPFSPRELMARIKAILKRTKLSNLDSTFTYKGLKIDFTGRVLYIDDKEVYLTPKEFDLLTYFVKNPNKAITRDELLNKVWGYDYFGDDRTIDSHIKILRNNLSEYRDLIITIRGIGYKFVYEK